MVTGVGAVCGCGWIVFGADLGSTFYAGASLPTSPLHALLMSLPPGSLL